MNPQKMDQVVEYDWLPPVCRRASYCHLLQTERDRILELRDLGLSLWQIATRLGQDISIVQHCVSW